jgi:hypothetical protein
MSCSDPALFRNILSYDLDARAAGELLYAALPAFPPDGAVRFFIKGFDRVNAQLATRLDILGGMAGAW